MLYAIIAKDKPDAVDLRIATRPAHLDYLKQQAKAVIVGPLLADDEQTMIGSLIVIDVATKAKAETYVANDPYTLAGLFASVEIIPWKRVL